MMTACMIADASLRALNTHEVSNQVPTSSSIEEGKKSTVAPDKPAIVLLPEFLSAESIWVLFSTYMCNGFPN